MLRIYIKTAVRTLLRNRLFSFINIFGLALSLSVCMMVLLRLKDQLDYDTFHPRTDNLYRVITSVEEKNKEIYPLASSPLPLADRLRGESSVESIVPVYAALNFDGRYSSESIKLRGAFSNSSFFNVFGFEVLSGNKNTMMLEPNSMVLSFDAASRLFGKEEPMGKMVTLDKLGSFLVTGVLKPSDKKSHLQFDIYVSSSSIAALEAAGKLPAATTIWNPFQPAYHYVLLKKGMSKKPLEARLESVSKQISANSNKKFHFELQSFDQITPGTIQLYNDISNGTGWTKIWVELGIALLILFAGCFNYTNLTIARALTRAKEVGIRKMAGAKRSQIFFQYITESICISLLALALGFVILSFILEYKPFNDGYEFMPDIKIDRVVITYFFLFSFFTGILAGTIPAWILSSFRPVEVLKNIRTRKLFGNISLQKTLIIFQFSLSLIILIFLVAFFSQFNYLSRVDTGFRSKNIFSISLDGTEPELLADKLSSTAGVKGVTVMSGNFGKRASGILQVRLKNEEKDPVQMNYYFADDQVTEVMGLQLVAGTPFRNAATLKGSDFVLLNEKAVQALQIPGNEAAVGEMIRLNDSLEAVVTGVVKNFYYEGTGIEIRPLLISSRNERPAYMNVLGSGEDEDAFLEKLGSVWKEVNENKTFNAVQLEEEIRMMNQQTATLSLLGFLGLVTITVGSLGLLGLVVYTVETRRKEISIRKVIGAGVQQLVLLLSRSFIRLLLIAGLIAVPLGYTLSFLFLQNFANRASFGILQLLLSFSFLLIIGLITIISQTWKAASVNPAEQLRNDG